MAQLDSGLVKPDLQPHDVAEATDSALDATRHLLQKHNVEVSIASRLPPVNMDVERIRDEQMGSPCADLLLLLSH